MNFRSLLERWLRRRPDARAMATESGIADVDPEQLTQPAGEGIDPDENARAHTEVKDLRERLP